MYLRVFFLSSISMVIFVFSPFGCVRIHVFLLEGVCALHFFCVVFSGSVTGLIPYGNFHLALCFFAVGCISVV